MANKQMKRCSISLVMREMQIQTTMRYHFTPTRMSIIKKSDSNKHWQGRGEAGTLMHCWWQTKGAATVENSLEVPQKFNTESPLGPAIPLPGTHSREMQIHIHTDLLMHIHISIICNGQRWKQPKYPSTDG